MIELHLPSHNHPPHRHINQYTREVIPQLLIMARRKAINTSRMRAKFGDIINFYGEIHFLIGFISNLLIYHYTKILGILKIEETGGRSQRHEKFVDGG
jgi:hypothetical protein